MARYIDVDEFFQHFSCTSCADDIIEYLQEAPTADVEEVKHGYWIEDDEYQVCSECGEEHHWDEYRATYCEDCGAKMDGGKADV